MKVGCTRTALHIKYLHCMLGIVLENIFIFSVFFFFKVIIQICYFRRLEPCSKIFIRFSHILWIVCFILFLKTLCKQLTQIYWTLPFNLDHTCSEINLTLKRRVNTAKVYNQLAVNIKPEIVITRKLKDDIVTPVIKTARGLYKLGFHFHTKTVIGGSHIIQFFVLSRVTVSQARNIIFTNTSLYTV